jgi:NADH:ubiquinone oxidoreductase subunit 3 (subunit A)
MMNKITTFIGLTLAISFLLGIAVTFTRSPMIGFIEALPVYIIMIVAIAMMLCEAGEVVGIIKSKKK